MLIAEHIKTKPFDFIKLSTIGILDLEFLKNQDFYKNLSPKILVFYEFFCQNTGLLQEFWWKSSILTKNPRNPVFWDLEFL